MTVLLAATAPGIARAERGADEVWRVEHLRPDLSVQALALDPSDRATVWAGVRDGGAWRSRDRGRTWAPAGLAGMSVKCLAVDPCDPDVVVAGVKPAAVWRTDDGGVSWRELVGFRAARRWWWRSPADPPGMVPYVSGIAIAPDEPAVLLAGIEFGAVLRSEDGGLTWSGHRQAADRDCHDLRFHARDGSWVYEAGGGGPAVSRDGGCTWRHPLRGLAGRYAMACAADPARPEVWYVSAAPLFDWRAPWRMPLAHVDGHARAGIYRAGEGDRWERLSGGLPQPLDHMPYALVTHPDRPGQVIAGLAHGQVWHSADHGDSWHRLTIELGGVRRALVWA